MADARATQSNLTALVTGASSGIGEALAGLMAADGLRLVITARRTETLEALASDWRTRHGVEVVVIGCDLARPGAAHDLAAELEQRGVLVDYLVNNAGIGTFGPFAHIPVETTEGMLRLNIEALTTLTRLLLPGIVARRGKIMNIASTAAFQPAPIMAVYYASKAYVLHFSEALAHELADSGVTVTAFCPGPTASEFQSRAKMQKSRLFQLAPVPDSATVARAAWQAMRAGRRVAIPGVMNWVLAQSVRFTPRRLVTIVSGLVTGPGRN